MASTWIWLCIDCHDAERLAEFWSAVLDAKVVREDDEPWLDTTPKILFNKVPDAKTVKNRLHLDLTPDDQDAEVKRILALGARHADIGQTGEETWVVLADPEGNEFCVLRGDD